jgi:hypothetical protein
MDGPLVKELLLDDFEPVLETGSFVFTFMKTLCVITNNYMHSFMQRLEYWNIFTFLKKSWWRCVGGGAAYWRCMKDGRSRSWIRGWFGSLRDGLSCSYRASYVGLALEGGGERGVLPGPQISRPFIIIHTWVTTKRNFWKLKSLRNHLRSKISQQRLTSLATLCIENKLLDTIDIDTIISDFASRNMRWNF